MEKTLIEHPGQAAAFLLDWDGVLADTKLDFAPLRKKYFGGRPEPLLEAASLLPEENRRVVLEEINRIEMDGAGAAAAVPGAHALLDWLGEARKPWAVVSRNCRDSIALAAERCGITLPSVTLSREDPYVKPDPRALEMAAERLGVALADCVMVGDFKYDLEAARNAGIPSVLVRRKNDAPRGEWESLADFTYASTEKLAEALRQFTPNLIEAPVKREPLGTTPLGENF